MPDTNFWDQMDAISQLLGKTAAGAGSGRAAQANYQNTRDQIAARLYDIQQGARTSAATQNLNLDKYRSGLPSQGASEAVRGALIQNAQPATLDPGASHMTRMSFTGGTTPASFTPETRAAGAALAAHGSGLLRDPNSAITLTPGSGVGGTDFLTAPTQSKELLPSFWEQAAGATGIGTGLASALGRLASGGKSGGGDIGSALAKLKSILSGQPGGIDNSGNTEDTRMEDQRTNPSGSGVAYGPDGQPLPTADEYGYYDDASGQYIPPDTMPEPTQPEWYDEGMG